MFLENEAFQWSGNYRQKIPSLTEEQKIVFIQDNHRSISKIFQNIKLLKSQYNQRFSLENPFTCAILARVAIFMDVFKSYFRRSLLCNKVLDN